MTSNNDDKKHHRLTEDVISKKYFPYCHGWGIGDFTYQIILRSIFNTNMYKLIKYFNICSY